MIEIDIPPSIEQKMKQKDHLEERLNALKQEMRGQNLYQTIAEYTGADRLTYEGLPPRAVLKTRIVDRRFIWGMQLCLEALRADLNS